MRECIEQLSRSAVDQVTCRWKLDRQRLKSRGVSLIMPRVRRPSIPRSSADRFPSPAACFFDDRGLSKYRAIGDSACKTNKSF